MIKQAMRYENSPPGIHDPLKELREMERVCLEGGSLLLAGLFHMFLGTRVLKKQSQDHLVLDIQGRPRPPAQGSGTFSTFSEAKSRDGELLGGGRSCVPGKLHLSLEQSRA